MDKGVVTLYFINIEYSPLAVCAAPGNMHIEAASIVVISNLRM